MQETELLTHKAHSQPAETEGVPGDSKGTQQQSTQQGRRMVELDERARVRGNTPQFTVSHLKDDCVSSVATTYKPVSIGSASLHGGTQQDSNGQRPQLAQRTMSRFCHEPREGHPLPASRQSAPSRETLHMVTNNTAGKTPPPTTTLDTTWAINHNSQWLGHLTEV